MPIPGKPSNTHRTGINECVTSYAPQIYQGDCIELIPKLNMKYDFIFADPPFNIGQNYRGYVDRQQLDTYLGFLEMWVKTCVSHLAPSGVLALHGPDDLILPYLSTMRGTNLERIAWINWHYRFGQCSRRNWIDARAHCLIYAASPYNYVWNPDSVLVQSDRASIYGDKRIEETEHGGMRLPGTVWGIPSDGPYWGRVQGNSQERRGDHPNQLPIVYLERLLKAYTNKKALVLDPFCGSGTTAAVCQELERYCVSIDISEHSCESAKTRVTSEEIRYITRSRMSSLHEFPSVRTERKVVKPRARRAKAETITREPAVSPKAVPQEPVVLDPIQLRHPVKKVAAFMETSQPPDQGIDQSADQSADKITVSKPKPRTPVSSYGPDEVPWWQS